MSVHFTSATEVWETPDHFFEDLDDLHEFTLDVCATATNRKVENYFSPEQDGLRQSWAGHTCWMNPPYGRTISQWVEKAVRESREAKVVCLLPARTDTRWFHDLIIPNKTSLVFIKGRLKFKNDKHGDKSNAPFPSMVVIFDARSKSPSVSSDRNGLETQGGQGS